MYIHTSWWEQNESKLRGWTVLHRLAVNSTRISGWINFQSPCIPWASKASKYLFKCLPVGTWEMVWIVKGPWGFPDGEDRVIQLFHAEEWHVHKQGARSVSWWVNKGIGNFDVEGVHVGWLEVTWQEAELDLTLRHQKPLGFGCHVTL